MNVPEEVLEAAAYEIAHAYPNPGGGSNIIWEDAIEYARIAVPEIIEWARKEALQEAVDAVEDSGPDCFHAFGMGGHDESCGRKAALVAIRALAEGE